MRLSALILTAFSAFAADAQASDAWVCDNSQNNAEHIQCADREFRKYDADLNQVYAALAKVAIGDNKLQHGYGPPPFNALRDAQRAWITFRDTNCHWKSTAFYGGTEQAVIMSSCRALATRDRVAELKAFQQD